MNLNDTVSVELNSYGWEAWNHYWRKGPGGVPRAILQSRVSSNRARFQLHELMLIFGELMYNGSTMLPFVDNEVRLEP